MSAIDALYIFDEHNNLILDHVYTGRPPPPSIVLPLYLQQSSPRPSVIHLPSLSPPTLVYSIVQDNILFIAPTCSATTEPLVVQEFLHRVADALEEFLGSPLLASKITASYDIVAQVVAEMADAGVICQTEANALRDVVETGPGVLKNLLGSIGASGTSPALQSGGSTGIGSSGLRPQIPQVQSSQGSAIPWRRSNVRHTSNELYVDLVENLSVTIAPSGRPLAAFANGSIAFTCKVSGVPDLMLNLSTGGKGAGMGTKGHQLRRVMERVVFHPCVRLSRWKSEGMISFVPPDGRFALCGYEVDLLGTETPLTAATSSKNSAASLGLPAAIEVNTGVGTNGADFEVRLSQPAGATSSATASLQSNLARPTGSFRAQTGGDSKAPALENMTVHVPIPAGVRNVSDLRPSKGEANFNPADGSVEWRVSGKDFGIGGAVLRCTVQGPISEDDEDTGGVLNGMTATTYDYDEDGGPSAYQSQNSDTNVEYGLTSGSANGTTARDKAERNRELMPTSATLSFSVKGSLASGLKVESLLVDTKKSRGIGPEIKPYKGVKYLTVSRKGVEVRC
ncbi:uncharacterized protein LTR77_006631 [Saxophila tyrrhenica]|uniref:MHD domain-containing protein n=1 Tax=Saxophila tyrrhenica TaxID=1690608 RepID=A0AAV9P5V4_9PEZI|nr:hypothetical protein LTR77_006631 [Saxophila tyrrhenica]